MRRAMAILLQEKNFGPNVIYNVRAGSDPPRVKVEAPVVTGTNNKWPYKIKVLKA